MADPPPACSERAAANLDAALLLLQALCRCGLGQLVLCPGSRSAPLAWASGLLAQRGVLRLHTAIDERSAAFYALGLGRASGQAAAVVTTSGTAVANLLPAAVEADHGTIPLLLLSADRPARLKGCGANQTVNQEAFLAVSARWVGQGDGSGLASMARSALEALAEAAWLHCHGSGGMPAGPVHLNLPFEEPLHPGSALLQHRLAALAEEPGSAPPAPAGCGAPLAQAGIEPAGLDPDRPGLVVAGPWRGTPAAWPGYLAALRRWQHRCGWPLLADGLSGLRGCDGLTMVAGYDLLDQPLPASIQALLPELQVLRLGPLPASRRLHALLQACGGPQLLVSEGDPRPLDPLGGCSRQWSDGLVSWIEQLPDALQTGPVTLACRAWAADWQDLEGRLQLQLDRCLLAPAAPWGEPAIARQLALLLPAGLPLVIANSSPVRDWESFTPATAPPRPIHACRGASGIDGTLSIACGVAEAAGAAVLLSGDLALLHDSNGWLWHHQQRGRLLVVLIDNQGGGIFEQLPIRPQPDGVLAFEQLFAMPQPLDQVVLAAAHGVPSRDVATLADLAPALAWGLEQPLALLRLRTDRRADAQWRQALRRMANALVDAP
ncbi:MAG: 2-succinyl-5-enolpyruvyl-6-hydroxy-3-cyclohexene-1-carboxylic-acid synthase [Chitinophagaceae bacterium]|nr:2-succinyl-5-enolpyruvyl-6-hydroxy-3-cyclohexene-1-carboxylic-acid synthase [Chitinophagaceae bacterium]